MEFEIKKDMLVKCKSQSTRNGFKHVATLFIKGEKVSSSSCSYQNRTWESYEFESVLKQLLKKSEHITEEERDLYFNKSSKESLDRIKSEMKMVSTIAKLGEIFADNQKDKNDWKLRMLKAGLEHKGLSIPEDWDTLSEEEKEIRLNNVIKVFNEV